MSIMPWHQQSWAHLCDYRQQNRIPQALLITGSKGLGKLQLANQFAFSLLCSKPQINGLNCGNCNSCLLLKAETHPDLIIIKPEEPGKGINIGQIRNLVTRLTLKPQFEANRIVIVNPAELMNNSAANAFLKCLEEPTERTVIILVTDKPFHLPATIVSRCQKLCLPKPNIETFTTWLIEQNIEPQKKEVLAIYKLTQGSPFIALSYINNKTLTLRNSCFKTWTDIADKKQNPVIVAEDWHKLPETLLLFWITSWIIDIIKCQYQINDGQLYNPDLTEPLTELAQKVELKKLYILYDLILECQNRLNTTINKHAMFEEILIQWNNLNINNPS